jgi:cytochrome b
MSTADQNQVYVWDWFVRTFHWSLVIALTVAFLTEEDTMRLHVWAGYAVGILIVARVLWGFVGPPRARFSDFVYRPIATISYISDLIRFRSVRYLGHSPGGGAMIVLLLVFLAATVLTGMIVYGGEHQGGLLAGIVSSQNAEALEDVHNILAYVTLAFILAHVAAVVIASFAHRENLVWSMFTGYKRL